MWVNDSFLNGKLSWSSEHFEQFKFLQHVTNALIEEWGPPGQGKLDAELNATMRQKTPLVKGCIPFFGKDRHSSSWEYALTFIRCSLPQVSSCEIWLSTQNFQLSLTLPPLIPQLRSIARVHSSMWSIPTRSTIWHRYRIRFLSVLWWTFINLEQWPSEISSSALPFHTADDIAFIPFSIVQQVLAFQEFAEAYPFIPESETYFKCLKIRSLDHSTISDCSHRIEP